MLFSGVASTDIVICGAGVAGLTLAIRLAQLGRKSTVLEARSESAVSTEGVFLTLAPNGMNGLKAIDCFAEVRAAGIITTGIELRNASGKRLACVEQADHEREFGAPSVTLGRGQLMAILVARARSAGVDVRFDARLMAANEHRDGIALQLSTGERSKPTSWLPRTACAPLSAKSSFPNIREPASPDSSAREAPPRRRSRTLPASCA